MRLTSLFVLGLPLIACTLFVCSVSPATARTISVTGSLSSRTDYGDQISLSLPPGLHRLTVRIPLPARIDTFAFTQAPGPIRVTASRTPTDEQMETDDAGNTYRVLVFAHPSAGPLVIQTSAPQLRVTTDLSRPLPVVALPLSGVPTEVAPYLQPSKLVQSGAEPFVLLARDLQYGTHDEAAVADKIATWLSRNLTYAYDLPDSVQEDALGTLARRQARCEGWAHMFLALARASGLPARFAAGYSLAGSVTYPASGDGFQTVTISGVSQPHAWVEVWYPGAGWVPYDPQSSSGFVDAHHIRNFVGLDAFSQRPLLSWSITPGSYGPTYTETPTGGSPVDMNDVRYAYSRYEPRGGELISRAAAFPPDSATDVAENSRYPGW